MFVYGRETTGLPYDVRRYIVRIRRDVRIAEHHTPRREVQTWDIATMSDRVMREMSEHLFCLSAFREGNGAAMCRRPPRGWLDIVGANAPTTSASGSRGVPHGVRSTHLFPRSGIQWRLFLVPSISQKSGIVHDG